MKTILHTATLLYYDGPLIFEGRDLIGGNYVATLIDDADGADVYAVVGVSPESLRRFRAGAVDLKSLMLETPDEQWYIAHPEGGEDVPIRLQPQTSPLAESDFLPDDGLVLYDDYIDDLALIEARERDNVVLEFSIDQSEARQGYRLGAETLAGVLSHIQRIVKYSYRREMRDRPAHVAKDGYLMDVVIPAAPGSFRVVLEATKPSGMFGYDGLAFAMERMDEVFESVADPSKAVERLRDDKGHLARSCINLLEFLADIGAGLRYSWAEPRLTAARHRGVSQVEAGNLSRILSEFVNVRREDATLEGELERANRSAGNWALLTKEGVKSGKIRDDEISLNDLEIGKRYRFDCVEEIKVDSVGRERRVLYLKKFSAA